MAPVRLSLILLLLGMSACPAHGQGNGTPVPVPDTVAQRVETAFVEGDAQLLLISAANRVEVSLFGSRSFYSGSQAFYVLRKFFKAHPPVDFRVHDVTASDGSCFVRGVLDHGENERTLQVYVRLVRREQEWQLQEVRIDSDTE